MSRIKNVFVDTYATRNVDKPLVICTHDGIFHSDELMAIAIVKLYIEFNKCTVEIVRSRSELVMDSADLVFDVGMKNEGKYFDHHQPLNEFHSNNIPLATAGLVWKDLGYHLIKYIAIRQNEDIKVTNEFINTIWEKIDTKLIMPIDATDNGINIYRGLDVRPVDISSVINMFNNYQSVNQDKQFAKALKLMGVIIHNFLMTMIKQIYGEDILLKLIDDPENKYSNVIVMPKYINNWKEIIDDHYELFHKFKLILYPGDDEPDLNGAQSWKIVSLQRERYNGFSIRCPAPLEWYTLKGDELKRISRHDCLTFVHKSGFMGGVYGTKQQALNVCKDWIRNSAM